MSEFAVEIRGVFKIFGARPKSMVEMVQGGVSKKELLDQYGHVLGLKDIGIGIPHKGIQVIMGLSGSGKSTLIRHINRLIEPTTGEIIVEGHNVLNMNAAQLREFRRFKTSMVFQKFALLPHRTVADNVSYGLGIQGVSQGDALSRTHKWIDRVGLTGFADYYPSHLSGGMQQRVGLARALATDAPILLMDEPFSALDPLIRTDMQDVLLGLQDELGKTIIFITHDLDEALRLGDDIAILRDGVIVQRGTPQDIILNPADDYVSDFTKDINRGRVIQVASIMENEVSGGEVRIEKDTLLEDALQILAVSGSRTATVTHNQVAVGSVDLIKMITALAKPKDKEHLSSSYH